VSSPRKNKAAAGLKAAAFEKKNRLKIVKEKKLQLPAQRDGAALRKAARKRKAVAEQVNAIQI
jgi:hypothetical protein